MILHVFNADNDMALANFEPGYTPPASIQQMMRQTELLPARWAKCGDGILTERGVWVVDLPAEKGSEWADAISSNAFAASAAEPACETIFATQHCKNDDAASSEKRPTVSSALLGSGHWISLPEVVGDITEIRPWGWSPAICHRLRQKGIPDNLFPSREQLAEIRRLSSRKQAVELLRELSRCADFFCGESVFCTHMEGVQEALQKWPLTILKAPWSSSGKGIRYGQGGRDDTLKGWCSRILAQQGGVVVEPLYDKEMDFAMEFWSDGQGQVTYRGLSIFDTHPNGAYKGNRICSEGEKWEVISPYLSKEKGMWLAKLLETHLARLVGTAYSGPLGVDMMAVKGGLIHPCVEINLRMTMGFASLLEV